MDISKIEQLFKFSWSQAFSDHTGKTSITSIVGAIVTFTGCLGFLYSLFLKNDNAVIQCVVVIGMGTGLILGQKMVNGKPTAMCDPDANQDSNSK